MFQEKTNFVVTIRYVHYNFFIMNPLGYFLEYFETNYFTLCLALFLLAMLGLRLLRPPKKFPEAALWGILTIGLLLRVGWLGFSSYTPKQNWDPSITGR